MSAAWGYGNENGPKTWPASFPCAGGQRQSPINIDLSKVQFDQTLSDNPLKFNYNPEPDMVISNTGASMKADITKADCTMTGGPLGKDVYKLIQFHLHWGAEDSRGAEHTINGKVYSAELHLVHWNSTKYASFGEAVDKSDGLAVLCMFIKVNKMHKDFDKITSELPKATCKDACCTLTVDFDPKCLLPGNTTRYWTYPGSLTTPPCYESVQFILFEEIMELAPEQMNALRSLKFGGDDSKCMMDNFRPVCDAGSRVVRASFK